MTSGLFIRDLFRVQRYLGLFLPIPMMPRCFSAGTLYHGLSSILELSGVYLNLVLSAMPLDQFNTTHSSTRYKQSSRTSLRMTSNEEQCNAGKSRITLIHPDQQLFSLRRIFRQQSLRLCIRRVGLLDSSRSKQYPHPSKRRYRWEDIQR